MKFTYTIFTDGAARGKKSSGFIAAAGFVVKDRDDNFVYAAARCLGEQTNNTAEYVGLIMALDWVLKVLPSDLWYIHFKTDSQLVARQVIGIYEVHDVGLRVLCNGVVERLRKLGGYRVEHIYREFNKSADAMCNRVLDAQKKSGVKFIDDVGVSVPTTSLIVADSAAKERFAANRFGPAMREI